MKARRPWICHLLLLAAFALAATGAESIRPADAEPVWTSPSTTKVAPRFADSWSAMAARSRVRPSTLTAAGMAKAQRPQRPRPTERVTAPGWAASPVESFVPTPVPGRGLAAAAVGTSGVRPAAAAVEFPLQGVSYDGVSRLDQLYDFGLGDAPPDTMGAVGYDTFLEVINGSVAVFGKYDGYWLTNAAFPRGHVRVIDFFTAEFNGVMYPLDDVTDPRVLFDRDTGRWWASIMDTAPGGHVILAVSDTSDPMGGWSKYLIEVGEAGAWTDYPTLGLDRNGVYVAARLFPENGSSFARIAALEKAPLVAGEPASIYTFSPLTDTYGVPQPAVSFDTGSASSPAWFVGSSPYYRSGRQSGSQGITYRALVWRGTAGARVPSLSGATYVATPEFEDPVPAPAFGTAVPMDTGDHRLLMAVVRANQLWTCRTVGVSANGTADFADRTACEWLALNLSGTRASLSQRGRVFDGDLADPFSFYFPSLAVNGQGHVAMAFSGSSPSTYVGAYCTGRLRTDARNTVRPVTRLRDGDDAYVHTDDDGRNRWGDYSATTLDPSDDMTFWTIQEYGAAYNTDFNQPIWGTYISALHAPGPAVSPLNVRVRQGQLGAVVTVKGDRFFDAGLPFPNGVGAEFHGANPVGIEHLTATFVSPTQVRLQFDVAADAPPGWRDLTMYNPDGQSATLTTALFVQPVVNLVVTQTASGAARAGEPLTWTVRVANQSQTPAVNVRLTNTLPPSVSLLGADPHRLVGKSRNKLIFDLGTLAAGATVDVPITVLPLLPGRLSNRAVAGCDAIELAKADNTSVLLTVVSSAVLAGSALAVDDAGVREGDAGFTTLTFDVLLQPASRTTVRVPFATADGSALAGRDYLPTNGVLVFGAGQTRKQVSVRIVGDTVPEPDETLRLVLTPPANVLARRVSGLGVIRDDDLTQPREYANAAAIQIPGDGAAQLYPSSIVVSGLRGPVGGVRVTLQRLWHTYPSDLDMLLVGPQGQAVMLLSDAGTSLPIDPGSPVTLTFDDAADRFAPDWSALMSGAYRPTDYDADEDDALADPAPPGPYASALSVFNGSDPNGAWRLYVFDDFPEDGGAILDGWTLEITAAAALPEANLAVKATSPSGPVAVTSLVNYELTVTNLGPATATNATLTDLLPAGAVYVSASMPPATVSGNVVSFALGDLPPGSGTRVTVVTSNALAGTFFNVASAASAVSDPDPAGNVISNQVAVLPLVRITARDASASEPGTDTGRLLISRVGGNRGELRVNYSVAGTAQQGLDFATLPGLVILPDRSTSAVVVVWPLNDALVEIGETVDVALLPADEYFADPTASHAIVTIFDNDPPGISISDAVAVEPASGTYSVVFEVSLSAPSSRTVKVRFATASGSARTGLDFKAVSGLLTFAPGETNRTVSVPVLADALSETNETFFVNLSTPVNGRIIRSRGMATIEAPADVSVERCRIVAVIKIESGVRVRFTSEAGRRYTLEWCAQPGSAAWQPVAGATEIAGTGGAIEARDSTGGVAAQRFYRIAVE